LGSRPLLSWEEAIRAVASRWTDILSRQLESAEASAAGFGVIGSNHTTNEENYLLQKFARAILKTNHLDHHRTAGFPALFRALSPAAASGGDARQPVLHRSLARSTDISEAAAILLVGNNPTDQHPMIAWKIREARRHRGTRLYVVHSQEIPLLRQSPQFLPVAAGQEKDAIAYLKGDTEAEQKLLGRTPGGREVTAELLGDFKSRLTGEKDVIVLFGAEITGETVSLLVQLGNQLSGQTRYIALGDYSNSRGASDMGLLPHLLPGYRPVEDPAARALFENRWGTPLPDRPAGLSTRCWPRSSRAVWRRSML